MQCTWSCSSISALNEGTQIHGYSLNTEDCVVLTSLFNMYLKCGALRDARVIFDRLGTRVIGLQWCLGYAKHGNIREARKLFNEMPVTSLISWNAMLDGYTHLSQFAQALDFVVLLLKEVRDIDYVMGLFYIHVLAFWMTNWGNRSMDIVIDTVCVQMVLLSMRCFISRHKMSEEALIVFSKMITVTETKPSNYNCGTVLSVCANISALKTGKEVHGFMDHSFLLDSCSNSLEKLGNILDKALGR
ncbi:hypothetical protein POM88_006369 [Heracleum sosnowskyi]|uniref:Pentatricopeptide repeat-containing protein n=1 Tax=Heracleum sosnowskyi TaxID=360622 RepID=A0AAD8J5B8_9APIA|nr:hypothetical protein POM88_006369 [Heracleum sosnowskyi]